MPKLRLSQLRTLLPYAAKLLPVLTGVALELPPRPGADLTTLKGEMESASRGLRTRVEGQSERLDRLEQQVERLATTLDATQQAQEEQSRMLHSTATLMKRLAIAALILLLAITTMCTVMLLHMPHA